MNKYQQKESTAKSASENDTNKRSMQFYNSFKPQTHFLFDGIHNIEKSYPYLVNFDKMPSTQLSKERNVMQNKVIQCYKIMETKNVYVPPSLRKMRSGKEETCIFDSKDPNSANDIKKELEALKKVLLSPETCKITEGDIPDVLAYMKELVTRFNGIIPPTLPQSKIPSKAPDSLFKFSSVDTPKSILKSSKDPKTKSITSTDNHESLDKIVNIHTSEHSAYSNGNWAEDKLEFMGNSVGTRLSLVKDNPSKYVQNERIESWKKLLPSLPEEDPSKISISGGSLPNTLEQTEIDEIAQKGSEKKRAHRILLSMVEGGNMLVGEDYALIGKDSLFFTMQELNLKDEASVKDILSFDFGFKTDKIYFIDQLDYHIDTYIQLLDNHSLLISRPSCCSKEMYEAAVEQLKSLDFKVTETDVRNGLNGEFVRNKRDKLIFITNSISDSEVENFSNMLFTEVAGLTEIYFTDKSLNKDGGIGCMFKGFNQSQPVPTEEETEPSS